MKRAVGLEAQAGLGADVAGGVAGWRASGRRWRACRRGSVAMFEPVLDRLPVGSRAARSGHRAAP